jgi:hypothetical protein
MIGAEQIYFFFLFGTYIASYAKRTHNSAPIYERKKKCGIFFIKP